MKNILISGMMMLGALTLATSCNDEWKDEQFTNYISFRAPLGDNGVTEIYVPYTRNTYDEQGKFVSAKYSSESDGGEGWSDYDLPVIVSGSLRNSKNFNVHFAADPDTLTVLNDERFQLREDLYYKDMSSYASYPENLEIKSGQDVGILKVKFHFKDLDLVDKWVLPIKIANNPSWGYTPNPRKNYAKAMLRVFPFNDWSGDYSGTGLKISVTGDEANSTTVEKIRFYVVDENTVFFYPGMINEKRTDRKNYKIYATFEGDKSSGVVRLRCDNPKVKFQELKPASYRVSEIRDAVKDYLVRRYVIIDNLSYSFVDYTSSPGYELSYTADGNITLGRELNSQITDPQYSIQW